ncbi:MAG: lipopolysaccharide heptosyltransferase II [Planctomycetes bacterium]|nr:lipopolysaccharide heptosyltransferase II [Planctomycetota bacterium]
MSLAGITNDTKHLAVLCPSWVGDVVMATPLLRAFHERLPQTKITVAVRPGLDELLVGLPWISEIISCETKSLIGMVKMAKLLRTAKPDAILLLPNSFRSALVAKLSGTKTRIGYQRDGRSWLLTQKYPVRKSENPLPTLDYYAQLAELVLGVDKIDNQMELRITDDQQQQANELLKDIDRPFIVLNPGANKPAKRWSAECFAAIADKLSSKYNLAVLVTGSPAEKDVTQAVVDEAKSQVIDLIKRGVTLGSLKAILKKAKLLITNDTGPRHIAAALGTPLVSLFGPTDYRWTAINCHNERVLVSEPFLPEQLIADDYPKICNMQKITVGDVLSASKELLGDCAQLKDAKPPTTKASK